jgi:long-chain acyl-CoA synthetase
MGATLNERFIEIVERRGRHTAFRVKREGSWQSFSFDWGLEQAAKTAFGLKSLGFETGSRIAILSENRPEWATTDYGAMAAGLVGVPLYTTLIGEQIAYILHDAEVKVVFVSSMDHLSTVASIPSNPSAKGIPAKSSSGYPVKRDPRTLRPSSTPRGPPATQKAWP